jgi:hypothetical protein
MTLDTAPSESTERLLVRTSQRYHARASDASVLVADTCSVRRERKRWGGESSVSDAELDEIDEHLRDLEYIE